MCQSFNLIRDVDVWHSTAHHGLCLCQCLTTHTHGTCNHLMAQFRMDSSCKKVGLTTSMTLTMVKETETNICYTIHTSKRTKGVEWVCGGLCVTVCGSLSVCITVCGSGGVSKFVDPQKQAGTILTQPARLVPVSGLDSRSQLCPLQAVLQY